MSINQSLQMILEKIKKLSQPPNNKHDKKYSEWLAQKDFISFIKNNINEDDVIIYLSAGNPNDYVYIHGVLVPTTYLSPLDVTDLKDWSCNPTSQWGIRTWTEELNNAEICNPFDSQPTNTLKSATQFIFLRSFEGRLKEKTYIDVSETILQPHDLHHIPERNAFCRLDDDGNIEEIIKVMCNSTQHSQKNIVTINKNVLQQHLQITRCGLVRFFVSNRLPGHFSSKTPKQKIHHAKSIYYRSSYFSDTQSMIRGFQVIEKKAMKIVKKKKTRKYEQFIAHDWKNNKIKKVSCDPKKLASYFEDSSLPFETTPAFFDPAVLIKYKNDTEKYSLTDTTISCRNSWYLQCYHINDAGQVFTYLIYLSNLPYQEQKYWSSFNQKPISGISKSAFQTDFQGEFDLSYEPLASLKLYLQKMNMKDIGWWKMKNTDLLKELLYPLTQSEKEWSDAIQTLNKIINEGLNKQFWEKQLEMLKFTFDSETKKWGSIRLIQEYLTLKDEKLIEVIHSPLHQLNDLRAKFHGHTHGSETKEIKADIINKYGSLPAHFKFLVQECDQAIKSLDELMS